MAEKGWIPAISDEDLDKLCKRIRAVVEFPRKGKCYIKPVNPRNIAFTWSPKPGKKAVGLKRIRDITTYHTWAYYGFFKPTIAEVIAQIPKGLLPKVVAFEIIKRPETADDLNREKTALNAGYHVATTRLYSR